jgi:hypothetical protein
MEPCVKTLRGGRAENSRGEAGVGLGQRAGMSPDGSDVAALTSRGDEDMDGSRGRRRERRCDTGCSCAQTAGYSRALDAAAMPGPSVLDDRNRRLPGEGDPAVRSAHRQERGADLPPAPTPIRPPSVRPRRAGVASLSTAIVFGRSFGLPGRERRACRVPFMREATQCAARRRPRRDGTDATPGIAQVAWASVPEWP